MPDVTTEHSAAIEQKTTTVNSIGGDTQHEVDSIMDSMPAFLEKKGVNLETGERSTPPPPERKTEPVEPKTVVKTEVKTEVKADTPPRGEGGKFVKSEPKPEPKADKFEDLSDEGINKAVESLKTGKQETKERFATVLRELKQERESGAMTKKEFEAAKTELAEAKKAAEEASKKSVVPEDVQKQQAAEKEELAMFRRQYQLEQDPELKRNFDDQVAATEEAIGKTMLDAGIPAKAVELIKSSGGWAAFSKSRVPMAWNEVNDDGETVTKRGTQAEYAAQINKALDPADSATIAARLGKQAILKDQKDQFITTEKKKASEYFQQQQKLGETQRTSQQDTIKKVVDDYLKWVDEISTTDEVLKDEVVPEKATKEQRAEIETANSDRATIREYLKSSAQIKTMDQYHDLVMNAAKGMLSEKAVEAASTKAAANEKRIAELEAELIKARNGGRSVPKTGALGSAPTTQEPARRKAAETADDILADLDRFAMEKG